jgi:hypothetical protein
MQKRDFDEERFGRWRRRASAIPGRSWSTSVADNIRAGARLRDDLFERGLGAAQRALREYHASKASQSSSVE